MMSDKVSDQLKESGSLQLPCAARSRCEREEQRNAPTFHPSSSWWPPLGGGQQQSGPEDANFRMATTLMRWM